MKVQRILACVDGSSASFQAARAAIDLAVQTGASVATVCVVDSGRLAAAGVPGTEAQRQADAHAALDWVARIAAEAGVEAEGRVRSGIVFEEILEEARERGVDVIVMGRTGRHGPGSGIIGSSALCVAEFTDRPLVLVPAAPAPAAQPSRP